MTDDLRPPYRISFDNARDPYAARNALGVIFPLSVANGGTGATTPSGALANLGAKVGTTTNDDAAGSISNGIREVLQGGPPVWSPPIDIEPLVGSAFVMTSARLHRFRRFIPYASTWTHAQGVAVNMQPDGDGVTL